MISSNEQLIKYLNSSKTQRKNFNKDFLIDKLYASSKKNKIIMINNHSNSNDSFFACCSLLEKWLDLKKTNKDIEVTFYEPNKNESNDSVKIFDHIKSFNSLSKHILVINKFETFTNIDWWIKEFKKYEKKFNLVVYLFVNEVGYLIRNTLKKSFIPFFVLSFQTYDDFLKSNSKSVSSIENYIKFLKQKVLIFEKAENKSLVDQLIKKVISLFWYKVDLVEQRRLDSHLALEILRYIAFTNDSVFNLENLVEVLKSDEQKIHKILKILEEARIIRILPIVSKNLSKILSKNFYAVFFDPIYYFAFNDAIVDRNDYIKVWISSLLSVLNIDAKYKLVQDFYIPLNEQVSIYNSSNNSFIQFGLTNDSIGPLMTYMKNIKKIKKINYFKLSELGNTIKNYEARNISKIEIK